MENTLLVFNQSNVNLSNGTLLIEDFHKKYDGYDGGMIRRGGPHHLLERRKHSNRYTTTATMSNNKNNSSPDEVFDHRFVTTSSGVRIHYVLESPPQSILSFDNNIKHPTVFLVHGWPDLWFGWRHLIKPLAAAGYAVIVPDLRGFGQSDAPKGTLLTTLSFVFFKNDAIFSNLTTWMSVD